MTSAVRGEPRPIDLPDADLLLYEQVNLGVDPDLLLRHLVEETPWQAEDIVVFGRTYPQPRLVAWYGDASASYTYSGILHQPLPWTARLQRLRQVMESLAGSRFNSVLLNFYRDGRDSMGMHADDEPELGPEPVIASLSLGAERKLVFRHRTNRALGSVSVPLPAGSVLVMRGPTQRHWKHGIRKLARPIGPRVNLTFRRIVPERETGTPR